MERTLLVCGGDDDLLRVGVGTVGRAGDRLDPVPHHDDAARSPSRTSRCSSRRSAGSRACSRRCPPSRSTCCPDFGDWTSRCRCSSSRSRCNGGASGIRAPSRAAAATSRSACSRRRTEKDAVTGTLLFNVMHYALRPWPWIITALCSTLIYPQLSDIATAFPYVEPSLIGHDMAYPAMMRFLPAGFLGPRRGGHARGVSLDDRDAPQLGHVVPRARLLSALPQAGARPRSTTCSRAASRRRC